MSFELERLFFLLLLMTCLFKYYKIFKIPSALSLLYSNITSLDEPPFKQQILCLIIADEFCTSPTNLSPLVTFLRLKEAHLHKLSGAVSGNVICTKLSGTISGKLIAQPFRNRLREAHLHNRLGTISGKLICTAV